MKSHVSMEQHQCIVCLQPYDTGAVLLHKRLKASLDPHTITGMSGMCPEHQRLKDEGYIALVECDPTRSVVKNGKAAQQDVYRTGVILHIRHEAARKLFTQDITNTSVMFVEPNVVALLQQLIPPV